MSEIVQMLRSIQSVHKDCSPVLSKACRSAADEIDRLQAIVDRLPKTADGIPVTPGMKVWHCANRHYGPHAGKLFESEGIDARMPSPYCLGEHCYSDGCQGDDGGGRTWRFEDCYSTRQAAEKARTA